MANRSYLYAVDQLPGSGRATAVHGLAEWNLAVPIAYRVLLTGSPQLLPSLIWGTPTTAIVGDYDAGLKNFERFLAWLPQTPEVIAATSAARHALRDPRRRGRYLVLEIGEIVELELDAEGDDAVADALESQLAAVGDIADWIALAPDLAEDDLTSATGARSWSNTLYYSPVMTGVEAVDAAHDGAAASPLTDPSPGGSGKAASGGTAAAGGALGAAAAGASAAAKPKRSKTPPPTPKASGLPAPAAKAEVPRFGLNDPEPRPGVRESGALAWGLGLFALACLPFLMSIVSGLVMTLVGRSQRDAKGVAGENNRNAANWGLTYAVASLVLMVVFYLTMPDGEVPFFPTGIPIVLYVAISMVHLTVSVVGLLRAQSGKVVKGPAFEFFKG